MSTPADIAPNLLRATMEQLARHAPFDRMQAGHLEFMVRHLRLGYYPKDAVILNPAQGNAEFFYIIKQGSVIGEQGAEGVARDEASWQLTDGECFPIGALLAKRSVGSVYRAGADTFCYELPAQHFHTLFRESAEFQDFCSRRIVNLLEESQRLIQARYSQQSSEQVSLNSRLADLLRRDPVTCPPDASIHSALEAMHSQNVGSMLVVDAAGKPAGIFTLHDLLGRVVLPAEDIGKPITEVMSRAPVMLPDTALASDAALAMARHGIRHVVVTRNSHLAGVISEKDLFALQRVGLTQISIDIRNSDSLESLQQCGRDISQLAHNMLAQGVGTEQLTQIISTLNDQLTIRIIELATQAAGITQIDFCWIALGSEGRIEQTLSTDQDNGIIFVDPADNNLVTVRAALLPVALEINRMLDVCGFPLCKGNIMASNPAWCLSLSEWKAQFTEWIDQGDPAALLNAAIFFDFRPLHGNASLAGELRDWLGAHARGNPRFLHQMAANALRNRPPLGVVRDFVVPGSGEHAHTIDLKLNGTSPFVDAARIFSLAAGVGATNTVQRLQQAAPVLNLPKTELAAWTESFQYIQMLRLRHQHLERDAGHAGDNYVNPDDLSELDRRILKEAFRQARKLQARLAMDYGL